MFLVNVAILLGVIFSLASLLTLVCRDHSHFYGINRQLDRSLAGALFNRLYFLMTTLTTIGYGDVAPATIRARLMVMIIIFTVVVLILKALDNVVTFVKDNIITVVRNTSNKIRAKLA